VQPATLITPVSAVRAVSRTAIKRRAETTVEVCIDFRLNYDLIGFSEATYISVGCDQRCHGPPLAARPRRQLTASMSHSSLRLAHFDDVTR